MKQIIALLLSLSVFSFFQSSSQAVEVDLPLESVNKSMKMPLIHEDITLEGAQDEYEFTYELVENQSEAKQFIHLYYSHSTLLISPSSLTVSVDGVTLKSVGLNKKKTELVIPLSGQALSKGIHTVSIQFTGHLKDGICLNQNTPGNWVTLQVASYINIDGVVSKQLQNLNQYPSYFVGTQTQKTQVIVPDEPRLPALNAAMQLVNYLASHSEANSLVIVKESDVRTLTHRTIVIGTADQFKTKWIQETVKNGQSEKKGLHVSIQPITQKQSKAKNQLLVITASSEQHFDKITTLTEEHFMNQLEGNEMVIESLAYNHTKKNDNEISFEQLGMSDSVLGNGVFASDMYYYHIPYYPFQDMKATLQLQLKVSESLLSNEEKNQQAELIVRVNEVPHSINLKELKKDDSGDIYVEVPLSQAVFSDSTLMTVQLIANVSNEQQDCMATDAGNWVYVDQSSSINFDVKNQEVAAYTFRLFPFPNVEDSIALVLPQQYDWLDIQEIYKAVTVNNVLPKITLYNTNEVKVEDLQQKHVLFLGGKSAHQLLEKENLAVHYNGTEPDLSQHGFINVEQFAFIQNNPWDEIYSLVVFDRKGGQQNIVPADFATKLKQLTENATIAVYNSSGNITTNKDEVKDVNFSNTNARPIESYTFLATIVLLTILIALFVYIRKKNKKK